MAKSIVSKLLILGLMIVGVISLIWQQILIADRGQESAEQKSVQETNFTVTRFKVPFIRGRDRGITILCPTLQDQAYPWIKRDTTGVTNSRQSNLTAVFSYCKNERTGNAMTSYFSNRLVAAYAGINFEANVQGCGDDSVLRLLGKPTPPNVSIVNNSSLSWEHACSSCTGSSARFPHACRDQNMEVMISVLKQEYGLLARTILQRYPKLKEEIDDVAIHVRMIAGVSNMGILPFWAYLKIIPTENVSTIGIVTQPLQPESNSSFVITGLQKFLARHYPNATVSIRDSLNDTIPIIYTRFIKARRFAVCTSSTFCLFATMASEGTGVVVPSKIFGEHPNWVDRLNGLHGLKVPKVRFIANIKVFNNATMGYLSNITEEEYKVGNYSDLN